MTATAAAGGAVPAEGWTELCQAQTLHLQASDALLGPIPAPEDEPKDVLSVDGPEGRLWGIQRRANLSADDPTSLWGPALREILQVRYAATPSPSAIAALLEQWLARLAAEGTTGTGDRTAILRLPAVETAFVRPLLAAGFAPQTTTAITLVRPLPERPATDGLVLRTPEPADREALLDLTEDMLASDIAAGSAWPRPQSRTLLAHYVDELLGFDTGWAYLAEDASGPIGLITLDPPEHCEWAAPSTSVRPVVYLGLAAVTPRARQQGVGRRLVETVHRQAARTGQQAILLDHASLSPLSTPFWHRNGYRPLWTTWLRPL